MVLMTTDKKELLWRKLAPLTIFAKPEMVYISANASAVIVSYDRTIRFVHLNTILILFLKNVHRSRSWLNMLLWLYFIVHSYGIQQIRLTIHRFKVNIQIDSRRSHFYIAFSFKILHIAFILRWRERGSISKLFFNCLFLYFQARQAEGVASSMRLGTSMAKHVVVSTELITSMCYCWLKQQSASVPYALLRCQLYWSSSAGRERQMPRLGMYFSIFVLYQRI